MKKYFNLLLTAMVMCAAVSMTSCSKDDDNDDPIVNPDPTPQYEQYQYYKASITAELLTYFDIKLVLSNDEKTKEVTLTTDNCERVKLLLVDLLEYSLIEIDGVRGVKNVQAFVTPKDNIEKMFAETHAPEIYLGATARLLDSYYFPSTGEWIINKELHCNVWKFEPKGFLEELDGKKQYVHFADLVADCLTDK